MTTPRDTAMTEAIERLAEAIFTLAEADGPTPAAALRALAARLREVKP